MKVVRNIFINIHYTPLYRLEADALAKQYERRGYTREADNEDYEEDLVIQLLKTNSHLTKLGVSNV